MSKNPKSVKSTEPEEIEIIVTLAGARQYVLRFPKDRLEDPNVKAAVQALLAANCGKPSANSKASVFNGNFKPPEK